MTKPTDLDPLGPEREPPQSPGAKKRAGGASAHRRPSRLDEEVERLRTSPTPTQGRSHARAGSGWSSEFNFNGVPLMGIFSRTRDRKSVV